ncbi:DUF443 family protein [Terribacillus saccharophilus]|uniref:DUF443 family protein n=1 Tax=Terribacillus saccharophilus TaxID=361277 RepID=UPI002989BB8D|nr:DUF443 family protein [Terribacillus saccharophilus]MCM3225713.1 DUF443 domain-containing protein [Terribacillus saccharophilus]
MNSEVFIILKNFRYQLIKIDNKFYIIDKDRPFLLVYLLPFLYWYFPKRINQISEESANLLQTIPNKDTKNAKLSFFAVGISMALASLLRPITDFFSISITPLVASLIVILFAVFLIYFRFLIGIQNKKSILNKIDLDNNSNDLNVYVFPTPLKKMFSLTLMILFTMILVSGAMFAFIVSGNLIILVTYIVFFFILLFFNILTVPHGKNTIKIIIR